MREDEKKDEKRMKNVNGIKKKKNAGNKMKIYEKDEKEKIKKNENDEKKDKK